MCTPRSYTCSGSILTNSKFPDASAWSATSARSSRRCWRDLLSAEPQRHRAKAHHEHRHGEHISEPGIEGDLRLLRKTHLLREHAFDEHAAGLRIHQLVALPDAALCIHETGDPGVAGAGHGPAQLDAAEDGVGEVDFVLVALQEPSVVRQVHDDLRRGP